MILTAAWNWEAGEMIAESAAFQGSAIRMCLPKSSRYMAYGGVTDSAYVYASAGGHVLLKDNSLAVRDGVFWIVHDRDASRYLTPESLAERIKYEVAVYLLGGGRRYFTEQPSPCPEELQPPEDKKRTEHGKS